jgi:hypothetical protein
MVPTYSLPTAAMEGEKPPTPTATKNIFLRPIRGTGWLVVLAVVVVLVLGNYHVVSGAPTLLVARPYFGFSDMFASARMCTSMPWIIAKAQHPSLCLALQEAGLIESDDAFQSRIKRENEGEARAMRECMDACDFGSERFSECIAAC